MTGRGFIVSAFEPLDLARDLADFIAQIRLDGGCSLLLSVRSSEMRAARAWLFALLATLLLLPSTGAAHSEHYCRMLGRVVASCCCDDGATARAPTPTQQLQADNCCRRLTSPSRSTSLGVGKALRGLVAEVRPPVLLEPQASATAGTGSQCAESTQAPLAIGPPLFVKHCALLS
jgi:hypothetical protein